MEISKTNCNLLFIARRCMRQDAAKPHGLECAQDLIDCLMLLLLCGCECVWVGVSGRVYAVYVCILLCHAVHDIDLLIMAPFASCLLTVALAATFQCFASVWFGLVWFSFRFIFNLAMPQSMALFNSCRMPAYSAHLQSVLILP